MDFETLGLSPRLVTRLSELGITVPTPIQAQAIPHALNGRDVMGLAQTGTGKTAAFGLPMVHALAALGRKPAPGRTHGLILAPTRELAKQISETLKDLVRGTHMNVALVVGGASLNRQAEQFRKGQDLLVATPGRLIDLIDRRTIGLGDTRYLVLDEADQMLDMGFIHALRRIAPLLPEKRQTMMFSATMPKLMADLSRTYLTDPVRVEVARPGLAVERIRQSIHFVPQPEKGALLDGMLARHGGKRALVFTRTKHGAERLMKQLVRSGHAAASIHGNKSQGQRDRAIAAFKAGDCETLVATDVAARGLDIEAVEYVYNFDLPNVAENYVHRIGRTARAGADGAAIAFCAPEEASELHSIQKLLGGDIPIAGGTPPAPGSAPKPRGGKGGGSSRGKPHGASAGGKAPGKDAARKPRPARPRRRNARKAA